MKNSLNQDPDFSNDPYYEAIKKFNKEMKSENKILIGILFLIIVLITGMTIFISWSQVLGLIN